MATKGIDVSKHQGKIDWSAASKDANCKFVILRAGYGKTLSQKDERFDENYDGCRKNGIPVGAYWYSYATNEAEALEEAKTCIQVLANREFQYPIYYDIEEQKALSKGKETVSAMAKAFCFEIEKAGYWAGIYMSASPASSLISDEIKDRFAVWIADYRKRESAGYNGQHGMWQYSSQEHVQGISGRVDMNICYVDYPARIGAKNAGNQPETANTESKSKSLRKGDKGIEVRKMQQRLANLGYLRTKEIDGDFGKITLGAVLAFQFENGLEVDGICGTNTRKKLGF